MKVDAEGNLWFVDNGASFDFRACGKLKGWFWQRHDVADPRSGYLSSPSIPISTIFAASSARSMMQNSGLWRRIAGLHNLWLNCPTRIARRS